MPFPNGQPSSHQRYEVSVNEQSCFAEAQWSLDFDHFYVGENALISEFHLGMIYTLVCFSE